MKKEEIKEAMQEEDPIPDFVREKLHASKRSWDGIDHLEYSLMEEALIAYDKDEFQEIDEKLKKYTAFSFFLFLMFFFSMILG